MKKKTEKKENNLYIKNHRVRHDYTFSNNDIYEAGIALNGYEIKSVVTGNVNLDGAYCKVTDNNEIILVNMFIKRYENGGVMDTLDEYRDRKLLLRKEQIRKIAKHVREKGYTIVPVNIHMSHGGSVIDAHGVEVNKKRNIVKVDIAVAQGAKKYDKRQTIKNRDIDRDLKVSLKSR